MALEDDILGYDPVCMICNAPEKKGKDSKNVRVGSTSNISANMMDSRDESLLSQLLTNVPLNTFINEENPLL